MNTEKIYRPMSGWIGLVGVLGMFFGGVPSS